MELINGVTVSILSLLTTVLIGFQLFQVLNIKEYRRKLKENYVQLKEKTLQNEKRYNGTVASLMFEHGKLPLYLYYALSRLLAVAQLPNGEANVGRGYSEIMKRIKDADLELTSSDRMILLDILHHINYFVPRAAGNHTMYRVLHDANHSDKVSMLVGVEDGDFSWYYDNIDDENS